MQIVVVGESRAHWGTKVKSRNVELVLNHVVPDIFQNVLKGQFSLHAVGDGKQICHYTYGGDLAREIVSVWQHPDAICEDFNLSSCDSTTVICLDKKVEGEIEGHETFGLTFDDQYVHDVQKPIPYVLKTKQALGFEAITSLHVISDEVIPSISDSKNKI